MADENTPENTQNTSSDVQAGLENVANAAEGVAKAAKSATAKSQTLDLIMDLNLHVTVEVGRARMTIQDLLQLGQGSVLELQKLAGETLDIYVNGKPMAKGVAVIVNDKFGVRLSEIISLEDRIEGIK
jgi:flagellar motor switch protein FliN/FliY